MRPQIDLRCNRSLPKVLILVADIGLCAACQPIDIVVQGTKPFQLASPR